jgi:hypothetical protein
VSKVLKAVVALGCLICVLAIFIAPTIVMPETVMRTHHSVRSTVLQAALDFTVGTGVIPAAQYRVSRFTQTVRSSRLVEPVSRKVYSVMRC